MTPSLLNTRLARLEAAANTSHATQPTCPFLTRDEMAVAIVSKLKKLITNQKPTKASVVLSQVKLMSGEYQRFMEVIQRADKRAEELVAAGAFDKVLARVKAKGYNV